MGPSHLGSGSPSRRPARRGVGVGKAPLLSTPQSSCLYNGRSDIFLTGGLEMFSEMMRVTCVFKMLHFSDYKSSPCL